VGGQFVVPPGLIRPRAKKEKAGHR